MTDIILQEATGNSIVDRMLQGIIGFCELVFPQRIRGYYLEGSYATNTAIVSSDLDMCLLFKGDYVSEQESRDAWKIDTFSEYLVGRTLDIIPLTERQLNAQQTDDAAAIVFFKQSSRLLYGEDIRSSFALPSLEAYRRSMIQRATHFISWQRYHPSVLSYPLIYPDAEDPFFGYNLHRHVVCDQPPFGTERLVATVVRIAGALLAQQAGVMIASKSQAIAAYREHIHDEWASYFEDVFRQCREQWQYQIPDDSLERERLREFYRSFLDLENHFLQRCPVR
jgi:hypothetical protein